VGLISRYNDPRVIEWARHYGGKKRALRALKRLEAEDRDARTLEHKRRSYWRALTILDSPDQLQPGTCLWPWKDAYPTQRTALAALNGMDRHRKGQGLHPYPCRAGHWHLGRLLRRSTVAWKAVA